MEPAIFSGPIDPDLAELPAALWTGRQRGDRSVLP